MDPDSVIAFLERYREWVAWAGLMLCLIIETHFPIQNYSNRWRHFSRNAGIALVGSVVSLVMLGLGVIPAVKYAEAHGWGLLNWLAVPFWAKCVVGFFALDFVDYIFHRMSHQVRWLWLLHSVHHSDQYMDVSTSVRTHPLHAICIIVWKSLCALALGAPLIAFMLREFGALLFSHVHHANIRWKHYPRALASMFMLPQAHWLHHCQEPQLTNMNYGPFLSIWDHAFGTYLKPGSTALVKQGNLGLSSLTDERWQTIGGQLITPWRARKLDVL